MYRPSLFFTVLAAIAPFCLPIEFNECEGLPTVTVLEKELRRIIGISENRTDVNVTVINGPNYTCLAQGNLNGTYRELSVILDYLTDNTSTIYLNEMMQLDMVCKNGSWIGIADSLLTYTGHLPGIWMNCSSCSVSAGNNNRCQACNPACNIGLGRCTGNYSFDCCAIFENTGVCSADLYCDKPDFVAIPKNNFFCSPISTTSKSVHYYYITTTSSPPSLETHCFTCTYTLPQHRPTATNRGFNTVTYIVFSSPTYSVFSSPTVTLFTARETVSTAVLASTIAVVGVIVILVLVLNILPFIVFKEEKQHVYSSTVNSL